LITQQKSNKEKNWKSKFERYAYGAMTKIEKTLLCVYANEKKNGVQLAMLTRQYTLKRKEKN